MIATCRRCKRSGACSSKGYCEACMLELIDDLHAERKRMIKSLPLEYNTMKWMIEDTQPQPERNAR